MSDNTFFGGMLREDNNPLRELKNLGANIQTMVEMSGVLAPVQALGEFYSHNGMETSDMREGFNTNSFASDEADDYVDDFGDLDADTDIMGDDEDDASVAFKGFDDEDEPDFYGEDEDFDSDNDDDSSLEDMASELVSDEEFISMIDSDVSDDDLVSYVVDEFGVSPEDAEEVLNSAFQILADEQDSEDDDGSDMMDMGDESYGESEDLMSRIDSVLSESDEDGSDELSHNCKLVGDIAELMAHKYNDIGKTRVANGLIDVSNTADSLSESDISDEDKTYKLSKLLNAVTATLSEYESKVGF